MSEGTTILRLHIKNFQGIRAAELDDLPPAGVIVVQGEVGAGKTSIVNAIEAALGGKAHVHERAIHDGSEGFEIDLELSNGYKIDLHSTPANPRGVLSVVGPDDGKFGQTKLNSFVGPLSFDPLSFLSLSTEKQNAIIMSLDSDVDRPGRIKALRAEREELKEERKPFTRELLKIRQQSKPEGDRPEAVDVSATAARLKVLNDEAAAEAVSRRKATDAERNLRAAQLKVSAIEDEIDTINDSLTAAKEALVTAQDEDSQLRVVVDEAVRDILPNPDVNEIVALEASLADADEISRSMAPWNEWDRAVASESVLKDQAAVVTKLIEENAAAEVAEFASIEMPIQDMEIDPTGEILWRGRPLDLASGGEGISIAVAVAFAVNDELQVCLLNEANNIGKKQLEALHVAAKERPFQIWACRLEGEGDITVEDGVATQ